MYKKKVILKNKNKGTEIIMNKKKKKKKWIFKGNNLNLHHLQDHYIHMHHIQHIEQIIYLSNISLGKILLI